MLTTYYRSSKAALCVWVYAVHFWVISLWTLLILQAESRPLFTTIHGFYKLLASVSIIVCAQLALLAARHLSSGQTYTRRRVFSNAVQVFRALLPGLPFHVRVAMFFCILDAKETLRSDILSHIISRFCMLWSRDSADTTCLCSGVGPRRGTQPLIAPMHPFMMVQVTFFCFCYTRPKSLTRLSCVDPKTYENVVFPLFCVLVCGMAYSLNFSLTHAGCLRFPPIQLKRFTRLRLEFPGVLVRSFVFSIWVVGVVALFLGISHTFQRITYWLINSLLDVAVSELFPSRAAVANAIVLCWQSLTLCSIAAQLYEIFMTEAKPLSASTPLPISAEKEVDLLIDSIRLCETGSVVEAMLSFPLPDLALKEQLTKSTDRLIPSALMLQAKGESDMSEFLQWWQLVIGSLANQGVSPMWEQFCLLREKRLDAVTQALYTCDSKLLGNLFRDRKPLRNALDIVKARALLDLSLLSEFSPQRRRNILSRTRSGRMAWVELADTLLCSLDTLTVLLRVSVKMCALEPTLPVDENGIQQAEAYVLGPAPREEKSISEKERKAFAWRVEGAVRKWKYRPVLSRGWWQENLLSELHEFNPITLQRQLFEEKSHRMKSHEHAPAWERQWHHQQKLHSRRWLRRLISFFKRTPLQCTEALFAEGQSITWATRSLCNMITASKKEDQFGVVQPTIPMILASLLDCTQAIEDYKNSPAFLGSTDPLPELEGNKLCRKTVDSVMAECDDALYRLTGFLGQASTSFTRSEAQKLMLQQFLERKR